MRRRRGAALIMALLVVVAAAVLALSMADRGRRLATDTVVDRVTATTRAAAQGGVERARWALERNPEYTGESLTIGDCDVDVQVDRDGDAVRVVVVARAPAAPFAETVASRVGSMLALRAGRLPLVVDWTE